MIKWMTISSLDFYKKIITIHIYLPEEQGILKALYINSRVKTTHTKRTVPICQRLSL